MCQSAALPENAIEITGEMGYNGTNRRTVRRQNRMFAAFDIFEEKGEPYETDDPVLFIVSQRTSSIFNADLIVVLDDGKVAGIGTHDELLQTCEVYKEIHMSQFQKEGE